MLSTSLSVCDTVYKRNLFSSSESLYPPAGVAKYPYAAPDTKQRNKEFHKDFIYAKNETDA